MLTRRQIRIKVMQCIYALIQSREDNLDKQLKFLKFSMEHTYVLYLVMLDLFREIHQLAEKHVQHASVSYLREENPKYPNPKKLIDNHILRLISGNTALQNEIQRRKLKQWDLHSDYVKLLHQQIVNSPEYREYMEREGQSFEEDRKLIVFLFQEFIAPNEKIYSFFEDEALTWIDDFPLINTFVLKQLRQLGQSPHAKYFTPDLLKDKDDWEFANSLLSKTLLKDKELAGEIAGKTPNWDKDRIAEIDAILLKLAICEFLFFPSIPERVTINEYLEIAKEYSTPKSSIFINGILDKLVKEYRKAGKLKKAGRGLL